ncbi:MAG TPA: DUF6491 family protein [Caulobacteraceae bacterium]|nr:DUF6491 family protein [Caulobacteraceae bacterium]
MKSPVALAASAAALAAISLTAIPLGVAAQPPAAAPAPAQRACFWTRSITNFAAVDTTRVYLRASGRRVFELTLFANCLQLNWVHRLGIRTRGSSNICEGPNPGVDVIVRDRGGIPGGQRCPVTNIRLLTPDEVAALPPRARP